MILFWIIVIGITIGTLDVCYMIIDNKYFNAEQSRKDSDASRTIKIDSQMKHIKYKIKEASRKGNYYIEINQIKGVDVIGDKNKEKLIQLGYKVEPVFSIYNKEYYKIRISWEEK